MARVFLAMNGKKINTLNDLRSNFNGKQMLDFFRAGRLQKWLEEQQENDLLETVQDFQNENYDDETLLSMLMAVFELDDEIIQKENESVKKITIPAVSTSSPDSTYSFSTISDEDNKKEDIPPKEYSALEQSLLKIKQDVIDICKSVLKEYWRSFENNLSVKFEMVGINRDLLDSIRIQIVDKYEIDSLWYQGESPEFIMLSVMRKKYSEAFDVYGDMMGHIPPELKHDIAKNIGLSYKKNLTELCSDADKTYGIMKKFIESLVPAQSALPVERKKFSKRKSIIALVDSVLHLSDDPDLQDFELTLDTDLRDLGVSKEKLLELDSKICDDILHAGLGLGYYTKSVFWYPSNRGSDFEYIPCFARIFRVCDCE